jgi:hypothetical protein
MANEDDKCRFGRRRWQEVLSATLDEVLKMLLSAVLDVVRDH